MSFLALDAAGAFQIVATVTLRTAGLAVDLAKAGATSFRLNASHMDPASLRQAADLVRAKAPDAPLVVDLQGAKMRLGEFTERTVATDQLVRFSLSPSGDAFPLPHPELVAGTQVGETLSCDDDRLRFRVTAVSAKEIEARVLAGGPVRPRKGINVVEHPVALTDLTPGDLERIAAVKDLPNLAFAFSFMTDGREAAWLRKRAPRAKVVGKVERVEATEDLSSIDEHVDAVWICRGDLGAQLGMARLAEFVSGLAPASMRRPVIMAGQVLEHLTEHHEPTRSEVCHLFDLIARGYAGIVLSDETAIGKHPVRAVEAAAGLVPGFKALL
ncbi:MAG TPA: pyruvate kinase [Myxococcales bacterium]|jgi:pyruvate kinase